MDKAKPLALGWAAVAVAVTLARGCSTGVVASLTLHGDDIGERKCVCVEGNKGLDSRGWVMRCGLWGLGLGWDRTYMLSFFTSRFMFLIIKKVKIIKGKIGIFIQTLMASTNSVQMLNSIGVGVM